jgi:hypothetical protein
MCRLDSGRMIKGLSLNHTADNGAKVKEAWAHFSFLVPLGLGWEEPVRARALSSSKPKHACVFLKQIHVGWARGWRSKGCLSTTQAPKELDPQQPGPVQFF